MIACTSQTAQNVSGPITPEAMSEIPYRNRGSALALDCIHIPVKQFIIYCIWTLFTGSREALIGAKGASATGLQFMESEKLKSCCVWQGCSLGLDLETVSRRIFPTSRSRLSLREMCERLSLGLGLKVKRLGLGLQRLVYKWQFSHIINAS